MPAFGIFWSQRPPVKASDWRACLEGGSGWHLSSAHLSSAVDLTARDGGAAGCPG